jgi:hypothetical protein
MNAGGSSLGSLRYRSVYRTDAARLDAMVEDYTLREIGVIEDDEPSEYSHDRWMVAWDKRAFGDFLPEERAAIRAHLGIGPFGDHE